MIMPCMKSTSACDRGGRAPLVEAGSVLLGCPGAPGCTTTGDAELLCCARESGKNGPKRTLAAMTKPSSAADPVAERATHTQRRREDFMFGMGMRIFESFYATTSGQRTEICG